MNIDKSTRAPSRDAVITCPWCRGTGIVDGTGCSVCRAKGQLSGQNLLAGVAPTREQVEALRRWASGLFEGGRVLIISQYGEWLKRDDVLALFPAAAGED